MSTERVPIKEAGHAAGLAAGGASAPAAGTLGTARLPISLARHRPSYRPA